jgi:WD40 repeat protein
LISRDDFGTPFVLQFVLKRIPFLSNNNHSKQQTLVTADIENQQQVQATSMYMNRISSCFLVFLMCTSFPTLVWGQADLPGETIIPGQKAVIADLPGEDIIPGQKLATKLPSEIAIPKSMLQAKNGSEQKSGEDSQIGEDRIPPDQIPGTVPIDPVKSDQSDFSVPKDTPWLYLNTTGPTATVRTLTFSDDSRKLFAGGQDKKLHSWMLVPDPIDGRPKWTYQKPVRWQVQRGQRGTIQAVSAGSGLVAFAGVGATVMTGEIVLADAAESKITRALYDLETGHRNVIKKLAIIDKKTIVSSDSDGLTMVWSLDAGTGRWNAKTLRKGDSDMFDRPTADGLINWRQRTSIGVSKSGSIVIPKLVTFDKNRFPKWNLAYYSDHNSDERILRSRETHDGSVTSVALSDDGKRIVSADLTLGGRVCFWDLNRGMDATIIKVGLPVRTVQISGDGEYFVIGTAAATDASGKPLEAQLRLYRWQQGTGPDLVTTMKFPSDVLATAIALDSKSFAYSFGSEIRIQPIGAQQKDVIQLSSNLLRPSEVRFSAGNSSSYAVALKSAGQNVWQRFDPSNPGLKSEDAFDSSKWASANPFPNSWKLNVNRDPATGNVKWIVEVAGRRLGELPIDPRVDGLVSASAWIPDLADPKRPTGLVVATSGRNHIYVFNFEDGECRLVRQFRGHWSLVDSLSVSADQRYLVSSSDDATLRFWKLDNALTTPKSRTQNLWGANFEIKDGAVFVKDSIKDGPLFFRGVRDDDTIDQLGLISGNSDSAMKLNVLKDPEKIVAALNDASMESNIRFSSSRGAELPNFYLYPAWQPLASLVISNDREWAFWTPYGYYDASFNGHKIFGWQINKGIDRSPDTFRAAELKDDFERPRVLKNLFTAGSVPDAFESLSLNTPSDLSDRLEASNRLRPRIEIVSPKQLAEIDSDEVVLTATIELAPGIELAKPKAFANGVPSTGARLINEQSRDNVQILEYEFAFRLPHESRIKFQVLAATTLGQGASAESEGIHQFQDNKDTAGRIYVLASGVNSYVDSQIQQLDFPATNAQVIAQSLKSSLRRTDGMSQILLTNEQVNRATWQVSTDALYNEMKENAGPDDLLVVFLSGHGCCDETSKQYFYLTNTTRRNEVLARQYNDCISFDDLARFAEIPCRKLLILDTCHSGAIQSLKYNDMKSIVRTVENDLIFTVAASEGSEQAYESLETGMGLFTSRLVQGLTGESDLPAYGGNNDGIVDLREAVRYVKATVPQDAKRIGSFQHPTASPSELIDFVRLPLTAVKK